MNRDIQRTNTLNSRASRARKGFLGLICLTVAALLVVGCSALNINSASTSASNKPTIKVGIDIYEPYTYYDDNGQITGFDYELAVASRGNTRTSFLNRAPSTASGHATA